MQTPPDVQTLRPARSLKGTPASPGSASGPVHVVHRDSGGRPVWPEAEAILVTGELSPSEVFDIPLRNLVAIVTEAGPESAAARLARELDVPAVISVAGLVSAAATAAGAVVDGDNGLVQLSSRPIPLRHHDPGRAFSHGSLPVELTGSVSSAGAAAEIAAKGVRGIGHFDTCDLIAKFGAEVEEQEREYRATCAAMLPETVRFSTCGAGPSGLPRAQAKALLAAASHAPNLAITIQAQDHASLEEARALLSRLAKRQRQDLPSLGLMVGTPADALSLATLVDAIDYLEFDTDALLAAGTGCGRQQTGLFTPGALRLLQVSVADAGRLGLATVAHGRLAASPAGAVFLAGIGISSLALPMADLATVEDSLRGMRPEACRHAAHRALGAYDPQHAEASLLEALEESRS